MSACIPRLARTLPLILLTGIVGLCPVAPAQTASQFEVATIKPNPGDNPYSSGLNTQHGRLNAQNVTLKRCIMGAYGVGPNQVSGGPSWVSSQSFDIAAKAAQPVNDDAELMKMLRTLLADRFQLTLHQETRTIPAYVLEVAKDGPKLEPSTDDGDSSTNTTSTHDGIAIDARNTDMDRLADLLARKMDLPVVNQTGLTGSFNIKLHWTPDSYKAAAGAPNSPDEVTIFAALPEQLGLRLRATKAPVQVLVIEHAELPTPN